MGDFDPVDRCNIYLNSAIQGTDLFSVDGYTYDVYVDTFTVSEPDSYFAYIYPPGEFNIDLIHSALPQIAGHIWASPDGDINNSGESPEEPLPGLFPAILAAIPDSIQDCKIHLLPGTYSVSNSMEAYPLSVRSRVSIEGSDTAEVILDGEGVAGVLRYDGAVDNVLSNLTIRRGADGGIRCEESNLNLAGIVITECEASGISASNSVVRIVNSVLSDNSSGNGGAIALAYTYLIARDILFVDNSAEYNGGAIRMHDSYAALARTVFHNNSATSKGGALCTQTSSLSLVNSTVTENSAPRGGGICFNHDSLALINTIMWQNSQYELENEWDDSSPASLLLAYSDITDGVDGLAFDYPDSLFWLNANIDQDPLFLDAENGDFRLSSGSPCIDVGTSFLVFNGDTLVNLTEDDYIGEAPDMGAFEYDYQDIWYEPEMTPECVTLSQNYPNPFNPTTMIEFTLPYPQEIRLKVYNVLGQRVAVLAGGVYAAGTHRVTFDASAGATSGPPLTSGIYIYRLIASDKAIVRKMMLLR